MRAKRIYLKEEGFKIFYVPFDFATGVYGDRKKQFPRKKNKKNQRNRSSYKHS